MKRLLWFLSFCGVLWICLEPLTVNVFKERMREDVYAMLSLANWVIGVITGASLATASILAVIKER